MADFKIALSLTDKNEGKYDNDPKDLGGETYRGIARNYNKDWNGWIIIDSMKARKDFPKCLDAVEELQQLVFLRYKAKEWNTIKGDEIENQAIANELYDQAVLFGVGKSVEHLQRTLNILNRNQLLYTDIKVDGVMGQNTLNTLKICIKKNKAVRVLNILNGFQIYRCITLMESNTEKERWIGWYDRVEIMWN